MNSRTCPDVWHGVVHL